jgi:hypothetical protein
MPRTHKNTSPVVIQKPSPVSVINTRPSLGQTMKEGFGLGVGVSVAQHAVNSAMNFFSVPKSSNPVENVKQTEPTRLASLIEYEKCMKYSSNDSDLCKTLLEH